MLARIYPKIVWVFLIFAIASLAAYTMDSRSIPVKSATDNLASSHVEPFSYEKTPPVSLGEIKGPAAYINIKLRFRCDSAEGYPNLFQTAPVNSGMRLEFSGSTAAIIISDLSVPGGVRGLTVSTTLKTGQWYVLEVEALNGAYVRASLDGKNVVSYEDAGLFIETSQLLVGAGFDATRIFRGDIEDILITKGNLPKSWIAISSSISLAQWMLIFLCGIAFLISLSSAGNMQVKLIGGNFTPTSSDYLNSIAIFGFSLVFLAIGIFSISLLGGRHLGYSKWLAHIMLSISILVVMLTVKRQHRVWRWARWLLSGVFLVYSTSIIGSLGYKQSGYDIFILCMYVICPLAFSILLLRSGIVSPQIQKGILSHASRVPIGISIVFLALSWSSLVELTNWEAFRQMFEKNFGGTVVGAFLILRIVFYIVFENINLLKINTRILRDQKNIIHHFFKICLDAGVIVIFLWLSFRSDSLFIPGSAYHWEYYVGVVEGVRNGGWLLWDTPSQYGFLNILITSVIPAESAWQSLYIFQGILLFIISTGAYIAARGNTTNNIFNQLFIFAIIFMGLYFADPELIGPYPFPSSSVVRFFFVYALLFVVWYIPKFGLLQAFVLSFVWSMAVIWSAESAIYATAISLFILVAMLQCSTDDSNYFVMACKYIGIAVLCLIGILAVIFLFYFLRLGVAPDLYGYFEHALGYAGGHGYAPFPLSGPGNLLLLVFMGISILCIEVIRRGDDASSSVVAPLAAMAGCIWGITTYYIGRPVPQNITAMLPIITLVVYFTLVLSKNLNCSVSVLPIKVAAIPLFFLLLIPVFNPKLIEKLTQLESFNSEVSAKLPKASKDLEQLLIRFKPSADMALVYYGDDAAPPIFSGDYARLNGSNWLPIPLQLLEAPVSEVRRRLYLERFICRIQPRDGILINLKGDAIQSRLDGFLNELRKYYDVEEVESSVSYTLYRFSTINLKYCPITVNKNALQQ